MYRETEGGQEIIISQRKRERAETARARLDREHVIRKHGLTRTEVARASTMTPGDPVSDYMGFLDVQAEILISERETPSRIKKLFGHIVQGFAAVAGEPPERTT